MFATISSLCLAVLLCDSVVCRGVCLCPFGFLGCVCVCVGWVCSLLKFSAVKCFWKTTGTAASAFSSRSSLIKLLKRPESASVIHVSEGGIAV